MNGTERTSSVGWVLGALVVLLIILIAWFAFTPADDEAAREAQRESNEAAREVDEETNELADAASRLAARTEARTRLVALETRLEAKENYAEVADELAEIRANLAAAYENATGEAREEYERDIEPAFENFEKSLRDGAADVSGFFARLLLELEADVRTDEEGGE